MKKTLAILFLLFLSVIPLSSRERLDILKKTFTAPGVSETFLPGGAWFPYPAYTDREAWDKILDGKDRERILEQAEKSLDYKWQIIPATAYLGYERTGDRQGMESIYYANRRTLQALVVGELIEGRGRFLDQIINGLWHSTQMTSWVASAHQDRQRTGRSLPDSREIFIDLASASYGAVMAIAWHFFHETIDEIDPSISYAVKESIRRNILDPYMDDTELSANRWLALSENNPDNFVNNWTPWCNSNVVLAYLLVEDDAERLRKALYRSAVSVDEFLEYTNDDGACEEGPSYWPQAAGRLYDYLQIMYDASGGRFDYLKNVRVRESGEFITRANAGDYVVNFADASARQAPDLCLVWNYGYAVGSDEMKEFALSRMGNARFSKFYAPAIPREELYRTLHCIRNRSALLSELDELNAGINKSVFPSRKAALTEKVPTRTWYPKTELAYMKTSDGWFFAAKGGHNNESHNHNDVGTCVLYVDGVPVLADAGVGVYTRQTFSSERYTIWSMLSPWHNLPSPNGAAQEHGREYESSDCSCDLQAGRFSLDIAKAYKAEEAKCTQLRRSYTLSPSLKTQVAESECGHYFIRDAAAQTEPTTLTIVDEFSLAKRTAPDVEHLLVKAGVVLPGESFEGTKVKAGELFLVCDSNVVMKVSFPKSLTATYETIPLTDRRMTYAWGDHLNRISLTSSGSAPVRGKYTITFSRIR